VTDAASIAKLRAICARLTRGGSTRHGSRHASPNTKRAEYELTLGDAFDCASGQGAALWVIEACGSATQLFVPSPPTFHRLERAASRGGDCARDERYEARLRQHAPSNHRPSSRTLRADLFALLKTGAPLSYATARAHWLTEPPLFLSHAPVDHHAELS